MGNSVTIDNIAKEFANELGIEYKEKILIEQPREGRTISQVAEEVVNVIKVENKIFFNRETKEIIEVVDDTFSILEPHKAITEFEKYIDFIIYVKPKEDKKDKTSLKIKKLMDNQKKIKIIKDVPNYKIGDVCSLSVKDAKTLVEELMVAEYISEIEEEEKTTKKIPKKKSINVEVTKTILSSNIFQNGLPELNTILKIARPMKYEGQLVLPNRGYDKRFKTWLSLNSPEVNTILPINEALDILDKTIDGFCFKSEQDSANAIAAILCPAFKGIYPKYTRNPIFGYFANRERAGKDYLAAIRMLIYTGIASEHGPIPQEEELKKEFISAILSGEEFLSFPNNKGHIDSAELEAIATSKEIIGRKLGGNDIIKAENKFEISFTANKGTTMTADLNNRTITDQLELAIEDPNSRTFPNPNLHGWVLENRGLIMSAIYAVIREWFNNGEKEGSIPFSSFPEFSRCVGGAMEHVGYLNPCKRDLMLVQENDPELNDMKKLFEFGYELCNLETDGTNKDKPVWIKKEDIIEIIHKHIDDEMFSYIDWGNRADQTKFGNKLKKFTGRILSDIFLEVDDPTKTTSRQKFRFIKASDRQPNQSKLTGRLFREDLNEK